MVMRKGGGGVIGGGIDGGIGGGIDGGIHGAAANDALEVAGCGTDV